MPNYTQKNKATKGNMAAQQKKKKYTSVENSDGTTTNTFEKKRKLGKNKGEVKKRVTSIVKKEKSGETKGLASVTQKYNKEGKLKKEKGFGKKKELASLRKSVKKNDSLAASQQRGKVSSMKHNALRNASKNRSSSTTSEKPKKTTTVLAETGGGDKFNTGFKMGRIETKPVSNVKQMADTGFDDLKVAKSPDSFPYAALMKGKAMTSDEMALAPSRQVMRNRENIDFDSSTDRGIKSLYTGKRQEEHHTSGMPKFITSAESGERFNTTTGGIDEGSFSKITTKIPERSKVTATESGENYEKGEEFYVDPAKMHAKHPSQQRMGNMVNKVATYNMPNVKAAQKKYHK